MARPADHASTIEGREAIAGAAARIGSAAEWLLGVLLIVVVAINVVNASGRYLFSYSVVGADELMVYTIILVVMAGAVLALARRDHINVNLVPSYARGRWRHALHVINDLAALAATVYAANASWLYVERIARLDTRSMALGLPMTIPHSAVLAGFVGMALVAAVLLVRDGHAFAVNAQAPGAAS
ncbi:MAG: TRAP transporter small permease [Bauldia litoralis]